MLFALAAPSILVQIDRIPKNDTFYSAVNAMFHATGDLRFRFALFNWMAPDEARDVLRKLPSLPMSSVSALLDQLAAHPSPLQRSELIACLCEGEGNETYECLKLCMKNQRFLDDVSEERGSER